MMNNPKLNTLRAAMHDLADDYRESDQPAFADTLREVADDPKMLVRFSNLLTHYETPKAAAEAMQAEAGKRVEGSRAAADLSGRNTASIIQAPGEIGDDSLGHAYVGRRSFAKTDRVEGNNFVD